MNPNADKSFGRIAFLVIFFFSISLSLFSENAENNRKEILLRFPLLSDKNATVISNALDTLKGIENIEACYELKVMIIGFDTNIITDETIITEIISQQRINTSFEKIYSSDIPLIRRNYKIILLNKEKDTN